MTATKTITKGNRAVVINQKLRKLQLAVDHIAAVLEDGGPIAELSEALDLIHAAESEIEAERDD